MRKIGTLPTESEAIKFSDFLYVKGIENTTESGDDGGTEIWVHDDSQLEEAKKQLEYFIANPVAESFDASDIAEKKRAEEAKADARRKSRVITREQMDQARTTAGFAYIPMVLAVLSVIATFFAGHIEFMPKSEEAEEARAARFEMLSMSRLREPALEDIAKMTREPDNPKAILRALTDRSLPEVRGGEVWRVITPIFVHFGILHIVFNLMWLRDLGSFFQNRFGPRYLALFVVVTGVLSNYGQLLMSGPFFGGMSGVNYALFGFLWMRGKFDLTSRWQMNPQIVQTMLVWFFVCFFGLISNVANTAHAVGLLAGMAWGYLSAMRANAA